MSDLNAHLEPCHEEIDHPFVMVPRDLIRNPNISPECKWFISYLLSHTGKWKVSIPYIIKNQKISKNRIYPIIKEATEHGYVKREDYLDQGKKRFRYFVSREPKFKNNLLCPQNQDTEKQDPENEDSKEEQSLFHKEREEQREVAPKSLKCAAKAAPSADADQLCKFFLESLKKRCPDLRAPNLDKWTSCMDLLLRVDKRDLQKCKKLIEWAESHKHWKAACLSPEKLRRCYDEMSIQMNSEADKRRIQTNRSYALMLKEQYPEQLSGFTFDDKYAMNRSLGKEISLDMQPEAFKNAFVSLFGGERVVS